VLAEEAAIIGNPQPDATEVIEVERVPCTKAAELALSGGIIHTGHISSLLLGLRAAGKISL
jgi:hypothetical protein